MKSFLKNLLVVAVIALPTRFLVAEVSYVPSGSMEPTIHSGDLLLVEKLSYRSAGPARGDIAVFNHGGTRLIKRVAAVEGDTFQGQQVPQGKYVMLGDNTANSLDSRYWGYADREDFIGRARFVLLNVGHPLH